MRVGEPYVRGVEIYHGLVVPSNLEAEVNEMAENLDGLPVTVARRRLEDGLWQVVDSLTVDDGRRAVRPKRFRMMHLEPLAVSIQTMARHHERALAAGCTSTLTLDEWLSIRDSFDGECVYCGSRVHQLTIEHVIPISIGGANAAENVLAACLPCNMSKNATDIIHWLASKGIDADIVAERIERAKARRA